jgi:molybdate transport system regulatory protein
MPAPRLSIRIDLPNGSRFGPGKIALLDTVKRRRSISAPARALDMSYRRAWLLIDDMNPAFSQAVVETFPGRSHGARAALTPFGERLIEIYRAAERRALKATDGALTEIGEAASSNYQADPAT